MQDQFCFLASVGLSPPNSVGDSDAVNSLLAHVLNEQGICPYVLLTFAQNLSNMDMGGPMQRMHSWLVRARRLGAVALSPKPRSGLQTILPAHLPQCPVPGVPPRVREANKLGLPNVQPGV